MSSRRCQHDPRNPRLQLQVAVPGNLPELCKLALDACDRIVLARNKFPQLGNGRGQRRLLFTRPDRERRSQRLEAIALVAKSVSLHMDVLTLRSGKTRRDGSCDAVDMTQMMKETGLGFWRAARARRDLISAGFLTWHQEVKRYCSCKAKGCEGLPRGSLCARGGLRKYRALPAVLTMTLTFLDKLGITAKSVKELQRGTYSYRRSFPTPMGDVADMRKRRREIAAREAAAKHGAKSEIRARTMITASAARVAKLYGRKNE